MLRAYCTYLSRPAFNIQNPYSTASLRNINSHLHAQYCKTKLTTGESVSSVVTFKVKQQPSSPKNNEAWQFEFPERTVRGLLQSSQHSTSLWILSCSFHNFVYFCYGTCLERHLEHWNTALSPNMKRKSNIHPPDCLPTPEEESIKHNIGFFLSLRLPMGFETPMWDWRVYSHIYENTRVLFWCLN